MPYIITTRTELWPGGNYSTPHTRHAVATLDEARQSVERYTAAVVIDQEASLAVDHDIHSLTESGGTIGPLPDGTVIEVERNNEAQK